MRKKPLYILTVMSIIMLWIGASSQVSASSRLNSYTWIKIYGWPSSNTNLNAITWLPTGDIIVVGNTDHTYNGAYDALVMKLSLNGTVIWAEMIGGEKNDSATSVTVTPSGDILVAGYTYSFGSGNEDGWIIKLNSEGDVLWVKTYGGDDSDWISGVTVTPSGDIIAVGCTESFGAHNWHWGPFGSGGNMNLWILKLDSNGKIIWQKSYGTIKGEQAKGVTLTPYGNIVVIGDYGMEYNKSTHKWNYGGAWVLKLNQNGNIIWQREYKGNKTDEVRAVSVTSKDDIILVGTTDSFGAGRYDMWVLKIDNMGYIIWQKTYGGAGDDWANTLISMPNGSMIIAGGTTSFGRGNSDAWILKLNSKGKVVWQYTYGGAGNEWITGITKLNMKNLALVGVTQSFNSTGREGWIVSLPPTGIIQYHKLYSTPHVFVYASNAVARSTDVKNGGSDASTKTVTAEVSVKEISPIVQVVWSVYKLAKAELTNASKTIEGYASQGVVMSSAEELLKKAQLAFKTGNYSQAYSEARNAITKAKELENQHTLKASHNHALKAKRNKEIHTLILIILLLALCSFVGMHWLIPKYKKRKEQVRSKKIRECESLIKKAESAPPLEKARLLNKAYQIAKKYNLTFKQELQEDIGRIAEEIRPLVEDIIQNLDKAVEGLNYKEAGLKLSELEKYEDILDILGINMEKYRNNVKEIKIAMKKLKDADEMIAKGKLREAVRLVMPLARSSIEKVRQEAECRVQNIKEKLMKLIKEGDSYLKNGYIQQATDIYASVAGILLPAKDKIWEDTRIVLHTKLEAILSKANEKARLGRFDEAINICMLAMPLAKALDKEDVVNEMIMKIQKHLNEANKLEELNKLFKDAEDHLKEREYFQAIDSLNRARKVARAIGLQKSVEEKVNEVKNKYDDLVSKGDNAFDAGDYTEALDSYKEAEIIAKAVGMDVSSIYKKIKSTENKRRIETLKKCIQILMEKEIKRNVETLVTISVSNRFREKLEVTIDFSGNLGRFYVEKERIQLPPIEPDECLQETVKIKALYTGRLKFNIRITSNMGSVEFKIPVIVTE